MTKRPTEILGIDLGTTKSVVALYDPVAEQGVVLPNQDGKLTTPSVVSFNEKGIPIVGAAARTYLLSHPDNVLYSVKRLIGRRADDDKVQLARDRATYTIRINDNNETVVEVNNQQYTPAQVAGFILKQLKEDSAAHLGRDITRAVISVPAYFNDLQRNATRDAGNHAGLKVERILAEPTAAALAFGLGMNQETVAVYDLGGGTFDISILEIDRGFFKVIAINGNTFLGGDDFDQALMDWMLEQLAPNDPPLRERLQTDMRLRAHWREQAKRAKETLSSQPEYAVYLPTMMDPLPNPAQEPALILNQATLERCVQPLIQKTIDLMVLTLKEANLSAEALSQILLVGSQTLTPSVRTALREHFKRPLNDSVPPDQAVARGVAIYAASIAGHEVDQVRDVTPLSLGIETFNGGIEEILPANSPFGDVRKRRFRTNVDGQAEARIRVWQGDNPVATENTYIGEVCLPLGTGPKEEQIVEVSFRADLDGILRVTAQDNFGNHKEADLDYGKKQ